MTERGLYAMPLVMTNLKVHDFSKDSSKFNFYRVGLLPYEVSFI